MDKVLLCACEDYDFDRLLACVKEGFETLGLDRLISPGMQVVLKPNLLLRANPKQASVTHPLVTAAVGSYVRALGAQVLIAESPGGPYTKPYLRSVYAGCGYEAMAKQYQLALYEDCEQGVLAAPKGKMCRTFPVIMPLQKADLIINLAKMKTHCMMMYSGAAKNMFGAVPGLQKPELHCRFPQKEPFAEMLVDLCEALSPQINVIDGILAMEGDGPSAGQPRKAGVLLFGANPFAVDMAAATLMHMEPSSVPMLQAAIQRGICPENCGAIDFLGSPFSSYVMPDFVQPASKPADFLHRVPHFLRPALEKIVTPLPKIRKKDCVGCGRCLQVCPQKTIQLRDRKAEILLENCIRCYCCHELCPHRAVEIRRLGLFHW